MISNKNNLKRDSVETFGANDQQSSHLKKAKQTQKVPRPPSTAGYHQSRPQEKPQIPSLRRNNSISGSIKQEYKQTPQSTKNKQLLSNRKAINQLYTKNSHQKLQSQQPRDKSSHSQRGRIQMEAEEKLLGFEKTLNKDIQD